MNPQQCNLIDQSITKSPNMGVLHCVGAGKTPPLPANPMAQASVDAALDKPTFLDCHSTIRSWLEYQHGLGRKAVLTPNKSWHSELIDADGNFVCGMIAPHEYDYFCSL